MPHPHDLWVHSCLPFRMIQIFCYLCCVPMVKEFTDAKLFPQIASGERRTYKRQGKKSGPQYESDAHRLAQRAKQIQYGENTPGYAHFMKALELYPELFKGCIPVKPAVMQKCSKRSWDGQIRKWRRALHMYDFVDFDNDEQGSKFIKEVGPSL